MEETPCLLGSLKNKTCSIFAEPISSDEKVRKENFEQLLLTSVRKNRALYDPRHNDFRKLSVKREIWEKISDKTGASIDVCRDTWLEMRHKFQKNVRSLYPIYRIVKKGKLKRKFIEMDPKMYFLWPYINKTCIMRPKPVMNKRVRQELVDNNEKVISVDNNEEVINVEAVSEIINLDDLNDENEYSIISPQMQSLVDLVRMHPELYDKYNRGYNNYHRKCVLWYQISKEVRDKATKLMKFWVHMITRYEWEVEHCPTVETPIKQLLGFLKPSLEKNFFTVHKLSYYNKLDWYEPIQTFREICQFVEIIKKNVYVVILSEILIKTFIENPNCDKPFEKSYIEKWEKIAQHTPWSPGTCELTWLTLRVFYDEIVKLRKVGYKFTDKWFFESAMGDIMTNVNLQINRKQHIPATHEESYEYISIRNALKYFRENRHLNIVNTQTEKESKKISDKLVKDYTIKNKKTFKHISSISTTIDLDACDKSNQQNKSSSHANSTSNKTLLQNSSNNGIQHISNLPIIVNEPISLIEPEHSGSRAIKSCDPKTIAYGSQDFLPVPNYNLSRNKELHAKPLEELPPNSQTNVENLSIPDHQIPHISSTLQANHNMHVVKLPDTLEVSAPNLSSNVQGSQNVILDSQRTNAMTDQQIPLISSTLQNMNNTNVLAAASTISVSHPQIQNKRKSPNYQIPDISSTHLTIHQSINNKTDTIIDLNRVGSPSSNGTILETLLNDPRTNSSLPEQQIAHVTSTLPAKRMKLSTAVFGTENTEVSDYSKNNLANSDQTPPCIDLTDETPTLDGSNRSNKFPYIPNLTQSVHEVHFHLTSKNLVIVQTPPLIERTFCLSLHEIRTYIQEVMSLPQLLLKNSENSSYWQLIEQKFGMPRRVCQACWYFLSRNSTIFHVFGSVSPLLQALPTVENFWTISYDLFKRFDENAVKKGWLQYSESLPKAFKLISQNSKLYDSNGLPAASKETQSFWKDLGEKCLIPHLSEIWEAFREVYMQYIADLEHGIQNVWPLNWWRVLLSLQFLLRNIYQPLDPMYFITLHKLNEEFQRCASLEKKVLTIKNDQMNSLETLELIKLIRSYSAIYLTKFSTAEKVLAWKKVSEKIKYPVEVCINCFCSIYRRFRIYISMDKEKRGSFNKIYYANLKYINDCVNEERLSKIKIRTPLEVNSSFNQSPEPMDVAEPQFSLSAPTSEKSFFQMDNFLSQFKDNLSIEGSIQGIFKKHGVAKIH